MGQFLAIATALIVAAGGTLYSLSISGALILCPSTPPLLLTRAM